MFIYKKEFFRIGASGRGGWWPNGGGGLGERSPPQLKDAPVVPKLHFTLAKEGVKCAFYAY